MRVRTIALREERGAVLPIVVLSLVAIFGMVVLTVDVGGLMTKRRGLVNAADSASLAAAQSFSMRIEAVCGTNESPAKARADQYAKANVGDATPLPIPPQAWQTNCKDQTVSVGYGGQQQLFFAPVLGFPSQSTVVGKATAHWGPTNGGTIMPLELDPSLTNQCIYPNGVEGDTFNGPQQCPTGYWFDNQAITNSGWGLMNLNDWNVDPAASCDNSGGASDLGGWILQSNPQYMSLTGVDTNGDGNPGPTYVCTTDGGKTTNWLDALASVAGTDQTFLFPVNDPAQMVFGPPTSLQKYAITHFAPMQVVAVYSSNKDADLVFGLQKSCTVNVQLTKGQKLDLTTTVFTTGVVNGDCSSQPRRTISNVTVSPSKAGDWSFDGTYLTWNKAGSSTEKVSFDYWYGGYCAGHEASFSNPNAYCLVLKWAGPKLIGSDAGASGYGPAMAVELVK